MPARITTASHTPLDRRRCWRTAAAILAAAATFASSNSHAQLSGVLWKKLDGGDADETSADAVIEIVGSKDGDGQQEDTQVIVIVGAREREREQGRAVVVIGTRQPRVSGGDIAHAGSRPHEPNAANPGTPKSDAPSSEGNSSPSCTSNPTTGNPVVIATGEKHKREADIPGNGSYALRLGRSYRSLDRRSSWFGPKWASDYDFPVMTKSGCYRHADYGSLCLPTSISLALPDGSTYLYTRVSTPGLLIYRVNAAAKTGQIVFDPYGATALTVGDRTYSFSKAGAIQSIDTPGGARLVQYEYGANAFEPLRVVNPAGSALQFTWSNHDVVAVRDAAGNTWSYAYHPTGMLASVTAPGSSPDVRTYVYEHPTDSSLLTGILINGVRYSTYRYDASGRVAESGLAGGEERRTFVYGSEQTTVTDQNGQSVTYTFTPVQGSRKLVGVSRAATSTCAAAASQTVYDANGWVDYTLDWRGNKTDYSYDASGKLLSITTAAGTSSALTATHAWSGDALTETNHKDNLGDAYLKVTYGYVPKGTLAAGKVQNITTTDLQSGIQRVVGYTYGYHPNKVLASVAVSRSLPTGIASTMYSFDTAGNLASVTNALGHQVTYRGYNGLGQPGRMIDANGVATDFSYDPNGNLRVVSQRVV